MDGIHDMGGMHGFGAVESEADEPVFHELWEAHAAALSLVTSFAGLRAVGIRRAIESLDPATYLASSNYERWAGSLEDALVGAGTLTAAERSRRPSRARGRTARRDCPVPVRGRGRR